MLPTLGTPSAEQVAIVAGTTPSKQRDSVSSAITAARPSALRRARIAALPGAGPRRLHEHLAHLHAQRQASATTPAAATTDRGTPTVPHLLHHLVAVARQERAIVVAGAALAQPHPLDLHRAVVGRAAPASPPSGRCRAGWRGWAATAPPGRNTVTSPVVGARRCRPNAIVLIGSSAALRVATYMIDGPSSSAYRSGGSAASGPETQRKCRHAREAAASLTSLEAPLSEFLGSP